MGLKGKEGPGFRVQSDCVVLRASDSISVGLVYWGLVQELGLKQSLPAFLCDISVFF